MRILIYGAGVRGSIYGAFLADRGHDVSYLARGQRAVQLRRDGLTLQGVLGDRDVRIATPVVVESLGVNDRYDSCLVTVRRDQVDAAPAGARALRRLARRLHAQPRGRIGGAAAAHR